jgi:hypothetical protein
MYLMNDCAFPIRLHGSVMVARQAVYPRRKAEIWRQIVAPSYQQTTRN